MAKPDFFQKLVIIPEVKYRNLSLTLPKGIQNAQTDNKISYPILYIVQCRVTVVNEGQGKFEIEGGPRKLRYVRGKAELCQR
jgi:hypothetical protein